ncbi:hypothetical protein [Streptomyces sp. NPDC097610]|uniref:hypothetical protein n=1 Tax=Streptomyces sp. NPDC097610 TaxID=3157227 RepID=UPI0033173139
MGKRKGSRSIAAREAARALQAQWDVMGTRRLEIATQAVELREGMAEFDEETERLVKELQAKRARQRAAMHAQLGALADEMIDTRVSKTEAAGRLGMTVPEMGAARKAFNEAVQARATGSVPGPAAPSLSGDVAASAEGAAVGAAAVAVPPQGSPAGYGDAMAAASVTPSAG